MRSLCFCLILSMSACSIFDTEKFYQTYPDIGDHPGVTIEQAGRLDLATGKYNISGYVVYICTCPPEALCIPCPYGIMVAENRSADYLHDPIVGFNVDEPREFTEGKKYLFSIEIEEVSEGTNRPHRTFTLLGYRAV